jgi:hypothetical protein
MKKRDENITSLFQKKSSNYFVLFDAHKVCRFAEFYSNNFSISDLLRLEM